VKTSVVLRPPQRLLMPNYPWLKNTCLHSKTEFKTFIYSGRGNIAFVNYN
jgi:hypothetical protein